MPRLYPVTRNSKGFTLLEVLIAITILTVMMLGTLKGLMGTYQFAMNNTLRDHAVRLSDEILTDYRNIAYGAPLLNLGVNAKYPVSYQRQINNTAISYSTTVTVANAVTNVAKSVTVQVSWNIKGNAYSHTTSTIVANK